MPTPNLPYLGELVAEIETDLPERRVARQDEAAFERSAAPFVTEVLQGVGRQRKGQAFAADS